MKQNADQATTNAAVNAPEVQTEQVQIGFEKALIMLNPNWRTALTPDQVAQSRHFYHQGVSDVTFLIRMSDQNMQQNLASVMNTVIVTGNEEKIAQLQAEAQAQAQTEGVAENKARRALKSKAAPKAAHKAPAKVKAPAKATKAAPVKAVRKGAKFGDWK